MASIGFPAEAPNQILIRAICAIPVIRELFSSQAPRRAVPGTPMDENGCSERLS
jgi:hypothetical protein